MLKDQRQKCSGEQHVRQAVVFFFFFFAAGDLAWLWGWKSHGGEREKDSTVQIFLGLEISIECIK